MALYFIPRAVSVYFIGLCIYGMMIDLYTITIMALIYCKECGRQISSQAHTCPYCGRPMGYNNTQEANTHDPNRSKYDWLTTLLLCLFLGEFGIHSFYTGKTLIGVAQLLTAGGCGIWWVIDFIMIIVGSFRDDEGKVIKNK